MATVSSGPFGIRIQEVGDGGMQVEVGSQYGSFRTKSSGSHRRSQSKVLSEYNVATQQANTLRQERRRYSCFQCNNS